jgi:hypothetical protein
MATLSLRDFLATGEFGGLSSDSERDELRQLLGEPDDLGGTSRKHSVPHIWMYGGVEFTFGAGSPSTLELIHFDKPDIPPSGTSELTVKPWVLCEGMSSDDLSAACDDEGISLRRIRDPESGQEWWETSGGVTLVFSGDGLEAVSRPYGLEQDVRHALAPADRATWDEYLEQETAGLRRVAMPLLGDFVAHVEGYTEQRRVRLVRTLVSLARSDRPPRVSLRHPLFDRVVPPVLLNEYDRDEPGSARTLLDFYHQLHGGGLCDEVIGDRDLSYWTLLERAMKQDPDGRDLQEEWLAMSQDWFEYATHDVPTGVLYGNDGATVSECEDLLAHVDQFEERAKALGVAEDHAESVQEWRYYFAGYREYLQRRDEFESFERFLDAIPRRPT